MLIKLREKSAHFVGREERDANSNINWSVRALETEESVGSIGIALFAFLSEHGNECVPGAPIAPKKARAADQKVWLPDRRAV
jgi:hypothetical protein